MNYNEIVQKIEGMSVEERLSKLCIRPYGGWYAARLDEAEYNAFDSIETGLTGALAMSISHDCNIMLIDGFSQKFFEGYSQEYLLNKAFSNIEKDVQIMPVRNIINSITNGTDVWDLEEGDDSVFYPDELYAITTKNRVYGASVLFIPEVFRSFSERLGDDLYILPSSIHEVLVISKQAGRKIGLYDLEELVRHVNETEVAENERLSDEVYEYNKESGLVVLAEG